MQKILLPISNELREERERNKIMCRVYDAFDLLNPISFGYKWEK